MKFNGLSKAQWGKMNMAWVKSAAAIISVAALGAQPCLAATDYREFNATHSAASAFAGLNVRMPLGAAAQAKPTARLQLTSAFNVRDASTGSVRTIKGNGLEIGAAKGGQPKLYLNGQKTSEITARLGMSGTTKTVLIIGGIVVLAVAVLASVADAMPTAGPREGAFD